MPSVRRSLIIRVLMLVCVCVRVCVCLCLYKREGEEIAGEVYGGLLDL